MNSLAKHLKLFYREALIKMKFRIDAFDCLWLPSRTAWLRWGKTLLVLAVLAGMSRTAFAQEIVRVPIIVSLAYGGEGATGSYALDGPTDVAIDSSGDVFVVDGLNHVIREIKPGNVFLNPTNPTGTGVTDAAPIIAGQLRSTVCAPTSSNTCGDGGLATSATLSTAYGLATDSAGNVYIAGRADPRIRVVCMNCAPGTSAYALIQATNSGLTPQNGYIYTVAGNYTTGTGADGVLATSTNLDSPDGVAVDSAGNLYIAANADPRIRVVCANCAQGTTAYTLIRATNSSVTTPQPGYIYAIAGGGTTVCGTHTIGSCGDGGLATASGAQLNLPFRVAVDSRGNVYIDDHGDYRVRVVYVAGTFPTNSYMPVSPTVGYIYPYAGNGTECTTAPCFTNGEAAINAEFSGNLFGMGIDSAGNLYLADNTNQIVYEVPASTGNISVIAGSTAGTACTTASDTAAQTATPSTSAACGDGLVSTSALVYAPYDAIPDSAGNIYIPDYSGQRVREIYGTADSVFFPPTAVGSTGPVQQAGSNNLKRAATTITIPLSVSGTLTGVSAGALTSQGSSTPEYTISTTAGCSSTLPTSLAPLPANPTSGNYYVCATFSPAYAGERPVPMQVVTSAGQFNFGLAGVGNGPQVALTPGTAATVAGTGTACSSSTATCGDGSTATSANLNTPFELALDSSANVYIADSADNRIREVNASTQNISTVAGTGTSGSATSGVAATSATLNTPSGVAVDAGLNVYIADSGNNAIREVFSSGSVSGVTTPVVGDIYTVAGGTACSDPTASPACGDGDLATSAQLTNPADVAVDSQGDFYIADTGDNRVRTVNLLSGVISTVAGTGAQGYSGDGDLATNAELRGPAGVAVDASGNIYIADEGNAVARVICADCASNTTAYALIQATNFGVTPTSGDIYTVAGTGTACSSPTASCGDGSAATSAQLSSPSGVWVDGGGNIYIADASDNRVREVSAASGIINTVMGNGTACATSATTGCADGGSAISANLNTPTGVALDSEGNLYIADEGDQRIREVTVQAAVLAFGPSPVGAQSVNSPLTALISNIGNAALTFSVPGTGENPSFPSGFSYDASSTCPQLSTSSTAQTLAGGASCTLGIDFIPATNGPLNGTASVSDNSLNNTSSSQTVNLSGIGGTANQAPAITTGSSTTFTVGTAGSFTVTATGYPAAAFSESGTLPSGVTFIDNGNGTATLAGAPAAGTGGTYGITITASNGVGTNATQNFTLAATSLQITSSASTTFTVGASGSFSVTSTGTPIPTLSETGPLPSGVTFTPNSNGTATLAGLPAAGTVGTYPITITASNGVSPNTTQSFTLTVDQTPAITSASSTAFTVSTAGMFTVTTSAYPTAALSESGTLPSGVTFIDNGNGTATLAGAPSAGTAGAYPITITASNGVGTPAQQSFTLTVYQAPAITSASSTTFAVGASGSFSVTSTGTPIPTLSETGPLPSGVTFTPNGNGTATLAGAPAAGTGGTYGITITASNGVGTPAQQSFTLTVPSPISLTDFGWQCQIAAYPQCQTSNGITLPTDTPELPGMLRLINSGTNWYAVNPNQAGENEFSWTNLDQWLNDIYAYNSQNPQTPMSVIQVFLDVPCWDESPACAAGSSSPAPPKDLDLNGVVGSPSFNTFVTAYTTHCAANTTGIDTLTHPQICVSDVIKYYEMWNEWDLPGGGYWSGNAQQLYDMVSQAVPIIRQNVSNAVILTPSTSSTSSSWDQDIQQWLDLENTDGVISNWVVWHVYMAAGVDSDNTPEVQWGNKVAGAITAKNSVSGWASAPWANTETNFNGNESSPSFMVCPTAPLDFSTIYTANDCAGQIVRWQLLHDSNGASGLEWYSWNKTIGDIPQYQAAYYYMMQYMVGGTFTAPCSNTTSGTVQTWTCPFTEANGTSAQWVWTPSEAGTSYTVPSGSDYADYRDLNGNTTAVTPGTNINITVEPIMLEQSLQITSSSAATFTVGTAGSFTVTTTGIPTPAMSESGALPGGVTFTDNGNGTATLAGTPAAGTASTYPITIMASNGVAPNATQSFALTVYQVPAITSANSATFTVSTAGSFTVTATGYPTAALSENGALPSGVTFIANSNGTATLAGTPAAGTAGTYPITITASNGMGTNAMQTVQLTVSQATPSISWATPTAITYGTALSSAQLDATSTVSGTFAYSPAAGTVLTAGTQTLSVTFRPSDTTDYTTATQTVPLTVNQAVVTVAATNESQPYGTQPSLAYLISGFVNGDTSSVVSGAPVLSTTATAASLPGTYPILTQLGTLTAANYTFNLVGAVDTVTFTGSVPSSGSLCNGAYNGTFNGNLTVSAGQVCIFINGGVTGNIQQSGGTLEMITSSIGGDLQINSGGMFTVTSGAYIKGNLQIQGTPVSSAASQVCGSTVQGDLQFQNNGTAVLIGASAPASCAGNTIKGNLQIQGNTASASTVGNTVGGNLTVQNNSAATIVNGNTVQGNLQDQNNTAATQVFSNVVVGNLQCQNNSYITGGGNTAKQKQGQCLTY